jgi:hypothetical protein
VSIKFAWFTLDVDQEALDALLVREVNDGSEWRRSQRAARGEKIDRYAIYELEQAPLQERMDAVEALLLADKYKFPNDVRVCDVSVDACANHLVARAIEVFRKQLTPERFFQFLDGLNKDREQVRADAHRDGRTDAKQELCAWLGIYDAAPHRSTSFNP